MSSRLALWTQRFAARDGGMGTWCEQVARIACRLGWKVEVCHFTSLPPPAAKDETLPYEYEAVPIPRVEKDTGSLGSSLATAKAVWRRRARLADGDLLLEIFGEPSDLKFWTFALAGRNLPPYGLIIGCRTFEDHAPDGWRKRLRNRWYRRWMQGARGILADGEDIRRELARHRIDPARVRVLYASIDTTRYHPEVSTEPFWKLLEGRGIPRQERPLLVYCGRLLFMNRPGDFLEILAQVPEAWGVVIGDGPDRQALEEQAKALAGRVVFVGEQPETLLPSAFRAADLCLFPLSASIAGISLVVPKAMACGAAVITNNVADLCRLVQPEKNGLLCEEGDIEGWMAATRRLLEDTDLRRRLGQSAAQTIREGWTEAAREQEYRQWLEDLREGKV